MGITPDRISTDEDLAREVLAEARSIAPCIFSLDETSEEWMTAVAILKRVCADVAARGSRMVRSQRIGSASVDYAIVRSAFDGSPSRGLRALCGAGAGGALPRGSFPKERPISRLWPETYGA